MTHLNLLVVPPVNGLTVSAGKVSGDWIGADRGTCAIKLGITPLVAIMILIPVC